MNFNKLTTFSGRGAGWLSVYWKPARPAAGVCLRGKIQFRKGTDKMDERVKQGITDFIKIVEQEMRSIKEASDRIADASHCFDELDIKLENEELSFAEKYALLYMNKIFDFLDEIKAMSAQADSAAKALFLVLDNPASDVPAPEGIAEAADLLLRILSPDED